MHMWMWFGYDLGEFMFPGLDIRSRWSFALTWIALFFVALFFEASKVYLAQVQRAAHRKLFPLRCDERRNLLCEREQLGAMEPTTSRNASAAQVGRFSALRTRLLVNTHQSTVFLAHNVVGYLLMLAVMVYNVHLLLAVVFGMMLGYFLFGSKLTQLQMQCSRRPVICTPECDDTAETSTPPLLGSTSSESELVECRTRSCLQPAHYHPAAEPAACHYGAKACPSRVARVRRARARPYAGGDSPGVEDARLLRAEPQGCCSKKQEPPPVASCSDPSHEVVVETRGCCEKQGDVQARDSPQITCCNAKTSDSQEQIVQ